MNIDVFTENDGNIAVKHKVIKITHRTKRDKAVAKIVDPTLSQLRAHDRTIVATYRPGTELQCTCQEKALLNEWGYTNLLAIEPNLHRVVANALWHEIASTTPAASNQLASKLASNPVVVMNARAIRESIPARKDRKIALGSLEKAWPFPGNFYTGKITVKDFLLLLDQVFSLDNLRIGAENHPDPPVIAGFKVKLGIPQTATESRIVTGDPTVLDVVLDNGIVLKRDGQVMIDENVELTLGTRKRLIEESYRRFEPISKMRNKRKIPTHPREIISKRMHALTEEPLPCIEITCAGPSL